MIQVLQRFGALTAAMLLSTGVLLNAPAAAQASVPIGDEVVLSFNSTLPAGLEVGDSAPQTWSAQLGLHTTTGGLTISREQDQFELRLSASAQHPLARGVVTNVTEETDQRIGLTFAMAGRSFSAGDGEVDVLDLAADPDGTVTRFDLLFTTDRTNPLESAFGEVRWHEPDSGPLAATARQLQWPTVGIDRAPVLARDAIRNETAGPLRLGTASVSGPAAADFRLTDDPCSGRVLAPGEVCTPTVAYWPRHGGPRLATLTVPTMAGPALKVGLSGSGQLGRSTITSSGTDAIDRGHTLTYPALIARTYSAGRAGQWLFELDPYAHTHAGYDDVNLLLDSPTRTPSRGAHTLGRGGWALRYSAGYRSCNGWTGTVTVNAFTTDPDDRPTLADLAFRLRCTSNGQTRTLTGHLTYQVRSDHTAPAAPAHLHRTGTTVTWRPATAKDRAFTIICALPGSSTTTPLGGIAVYAGTGTKAALPPLPAGSWRLAGYTVDKTGNLSNPTLLGTTGITTARK